jgi:predicted amidohydrolase
MEIIGLQLDSVWEDKRANHDKVWQLLDSASPTSGALVVLPEMFATGFSMDVRAISESGSHQTQEFLETVACEYSVFFVAGIVTTGPEGRGCNQAIVISPDGVEIDRYWKMHPFTYGGESKQYDAGDRPLVFDWNGCTVAPFICYDLRFPEIFRKTVRQGAQLYTVIANWPESRIEHWVILLRARAIENQAYVAGVNRCGDDPHLHYSGRSLIVDPRGEIIADAGSVEGIIQAALDLPALAEYRRSFPVLSDIRDDCVR